MTFTSFFFYLFIAAVLFVYFLVPERFRWGILLIFSIAFYATWGIEKLPFIIVSTLVAYITANSITKRNDLCEEQVKVLEDNNARKKKRQSTKIANRSVLIVGIAWLILLLLYVKVGKLFEEAWNGAISIIVPLGISYYTFSLIGYMADCYWKKDRAEKNFFKLLLFAIYFPKILQGPISKHKDLSPQLIEGKAFDYKNLCFGLQLMLWGYFKKLVIADRLAIFVNTVYGDYHHKSGSMLLVATIFGAFQLYCDFSGCMDIAAGFSEIIGIKLDRNFNHPFFSESASEFWRRWHITLGVWFKDYVYMPISVAPWMMKLMGKVRKHFGMSVAKNVSTIIELSIVWMLTGLWHGTGLNYVVWGVYWGTLIILGMLLGPSLGKLCVKLHIDTDSKEWHLFRKFRTFCLFVISRFMTIPGDFKVTLEIWRKIFSIKFYPWELVDGTIFNMGLNRPNFVAAILFLVLLYCVSRYEENGGSGRNWIAQRQIVARWAIYYGLLFTVLIFGIYGPGYNASDFVYMKF